MYDLGVGDFEDEGRLPRARSVVGGGPGTSPETEPGESTPRPSSTKKRDVVEAISFKKEEVRDTRSEPVASALSEALASGEATSSRADLKLRVYLPSKKRVEVMVPAESTVADAVKAAQTKLEDQGVGKRFELRLHDEDGEPDEDFPALDPHRKIQGFSDSGMGGEEQEFCLVPLPGGDLADEEDESQQGRFGRPESRVQDGPDTPSITVSISNFLLYGEYALTVQDALENEGGEEETTLPVTSPSVTTLDILKQLSVIYRIALFESYLRYDLAVDSSEQRALQLPTPYLPYDAPILEMGVKRVRLHRRIFQDAPGQSKPLPLSTKFSIYAAESQSQRLISSETKDATDSPSVATPTPRNVDDLKHLFMWTTSTAARFQEWTVVKTNRRGKRQTRIMGIDLMKITNRKVEKRRLLSNETRKAERLMSDVLTVEVYDPAGTAFSITFLEKPVGKVTLQFEASTNRDMVEIVTKLHYILSLDGKTNYVVWHKR